MKDDQPQLDIKTILRSNNLVSELTKEQVDHIFSICNEGYNEDENSRTEYLMKMEKWEKHVLLMLESKNFPWPGASNVMFPLIAIACIQFNARAYPALVPNNKQVVQGAVIGKDPEGSKRKQARRVSTFMSWQCQYDIPDWEEGMDKLLLMLPAYGNVFKKTFYNGSQKRLDSYRISPKNLVVNINAQSLEKAPRVSEKLPMCIERDIKEKVNEGIWAEYENLIPDEGYDDTAFYQPIEQHCYLDLDGDGYEEPYIVTFHPHSNYVARIVSNFFPEDVTYADEEEKKVVKIKKTNYYTKYSFIPSLGDRFYDLGFGELLFSTNESVNTLINQLIDSGTINNMQSGFLGKGIKMPKGEQTFRPGEWKSIPTMGDDIRKNMVPLVTKEPSNVLFQLLGMLISSGKELASVAEIFTGKLPGQNTPATTTMASIEQGMKVFTAIYKRVYRSLDSEFKLMYYLNKMYLDEEVYATVLDDEEADFIADFTAKYTYDICPSADPSVSSQTEAVMKARAVLELLPIGLIDPAEATFRMLEALEIPNIEKLLPGMAETGELPQPQEKPDPKVLAMQAKQEADAQSNAQKMQMQQREHEMQQQSDAAQKTMEQEHTYIMNKLAEERAVSDAKSERELQQIHLAAAKEKAAIEIKKAKEKPKSTSKT